MEVCAIFNDKIKKKSFINAELGFKKLVAWIEAIGVTEPHICMESTGCYSKSAAEFLFEAAYKVSVVNPLPVKAFRTSKIIRQKTDRSDSEVIAMFCLQNEPRLWKPKKMNCKKLHEINCYLDSLKTELNRLNNLLENNHLNKTVKKSINEMVNFIENEIKTLEEAQQIVIQDKDLKHDFEIITSIKGVGTKLAFAILANADVERFETGKQYVAFAGVTPSCFESGTSVRGRPRISKIGSSNLRKILYMNALVVKNHNENFSGFVRRLQKKGKTAKVIIRAIMRKLMNIIFGMLKNKQKFDKSLAFAC